MAERPARQHDGLWLKTARLRLRRAEPDDIEDLHAILSDPACMRFWSTPPHRTLAQTRLWLEAMMEAAGSDEFIVTLEGRPIGKFGVWRPSEIGFIFARTSWGRGFAAEAGEAFLQHAAARGLYPLTADVDPRNASAIRLLGRLGFRETGRATRTFMLDGEWCDSVYFGRVAPDQGPERPQ